MSVRSTSAATGKGCVDRIQDLAFSCIISSSDIMSNGLY